MPRPADVGEWLGQSLNPRWRGGAPVLLGRPRSPPPPEIPARDTPRLRVQSPVHLTLAHVGNRNRKQRAKRSIFVLKSLCYLRLLWFSITSTFLRAGAKLANWTLETKKEIVAKRHTWQVAMQMAAGRALHYAGQLVRRRGKRVIISLSSATTARDLQPARPGETRSKTAHRDIARNNSLKLQQLGTHVTMNVDAAPTSQVKYKRLQREAEEAARVGHLEAQVRVPGHAATAIPLWDELRIWDPGD